MQQGFLLSLYARYSISHETAMSRNIKGLQLTSIIKDIRMQGKSTEIESNKPMNKGRGTSQGWTHPILKPKSVFSQ